MDLQRGGETRQTTVPKIGVTDNKYRESQLTGVETRKQNLPWEPVPREEVWIVIDELLEAQCGRAWELKTLEEGSYGGGSSHFHEIYLQELN